VIRMNRSLMLAAVISLLGAAALCVNSRSSAIGSVSAIPQTTSTTSRMEQIVQDSVSRKVFMGTVLVARGDEILLDKGYGFANLELDVPDTPPTKFRLGSVTKQFTSAAIMLLQERGKINVNDLVKKYMPDAPAAWDKITIFNILTHTSGIPNYTNFPEYPALQAIPTTPQKLVARFIDKPLDFQPGEKYSYSNSGYIVLGYLVEKLSGETYEKFLQENIFAPLGMNDSGYDSNTALIPHRAEGYAPNPAGGILNADYTDMTVPFSAGALYSTTEDMLRWEKGLYGGKLLKPESLVMMTTPFKNNYAFGLEVRTVNGHKVINHSGGIQGFNTMVSYYPDDKLEVIVLSNINGAAPQDLSTKLAAVAHGEKVILSSERKQIQVDPKVFEGYIGRYQLMPNIVVTVSRDGNHLFSQTNAQPKSEIFPEAENDYFMKAVDAQITFVTDGQGHATEIILHQNGQDRQAKRIEGDSPVPK
jgi:CubicO group peptidase (beta-lactamase class C family)